MANAEQATEAHMKALTPPEEARAESIRRQVAIRKDPLRTPTSAKAHYKKTLPSSLAVGAREQMACLIAVTANGDGLYLQQGRYFSYWYIRFNHGKVSEWTTVGAMGRSMPRKAPLDQRWSHIPRDEWWG